MKIIRIDSCATPQVAFVKGSAKTEHRASMLNE